MPAPPPSPAEIADFLSQRVVGQPTAVREMSIALSKRLAGLRAGNVLMIGSSGTGKTTLMRAVEELLAGRPGADRRTISVRLHANVLADEARRGRPGEAVVGRVLERLRGEREAGLPTRELLARVGSALVFVDEIDKIRAEVGGQANVAGIRAQESLLTLMENEAIPITLPEWAGGDRVALDSRGILFVAAGAFEGLYDSVYDRVTVGRDRGALQPVTVLEEGAVREESHFALHEWLRSEDLFDYGMTPQFLSRFDAVVLLDDLGVGELERIFLEAPDSGLAQSRAYFDAHGVELVVSPAAVRRIARQAARQPRLGARALKEVFRRVIRDFEYDPTAAVTADSKLLIDLAEVEAALAGDEEGASRP